jgi:hypothetical protein
VFNSPGKPSLGRPKEGGWIEMVQDHIQWQALVLAVFNIET